MAAPITSNAASNMPVEPARSFTTIERVSYTIVACAGVAIGAGICYATATTTPYVLSVVVISSTVALTIARAVFLLREKPLAQPLIAEPTQAETAVPTAPQAPITNRIKSIAIVAAIGAGISTFALIAPFPVLATCIIMPTAILTLFCITLPFGSLAPQQEPTQQVELASVADPQAAQARTEAEREELPAEKASLTLLANIVMLVAFAAIGVGLCALIAPHYFVNTVIITSIALCAITIAMAISSGTEAQQADQERNTETHPQLNNATLVQMIEMARPNIVHAIQHALLPFRNMATRQQATINALRAENASLRGRIEVLTRRLSGRGGA